MTKLEEVNETWRDITEEWSKLSETKGAIAEMPTSTGDLRSKEILKGTYLKLQRTQWEIISSALR